LIRVSAFLGSDPFWPSPEIDVTIFHLKRSGPLPKSGIRRISPRSQLLKLREHVKKVVYGGVVVQLG
jgi:hypothetical protein